MIKTKEKLDRYDKIIILIILVVTLYSCASTRSCDILKRVNEYEYIFNYAKNNKDRLEIVYSNNNKEYLEFYYKNDERKSRKLKDSILIENFDKLKIFSFEYFPSENKSIIEFKSISYIQKRRFLLKKNSLDDVQNYEGLKKINDSLYFYFRKPNRY